LDEEAFRQSVDALDVGIIPQGGTALTQAIETALRAFKDEDNHKVIVLFTDGEDHEAGAGEAAGRAAQSGVRIYTVGVGTPNGELLRHRDENGAMTYIKDAQGNVVKSRLNETLLTQVATAGNGFYLPMSGASTVDVLYERGLSQLPKSEISSRLVRRYKERFYWPLACAILLLLTELLLVERRRLQPTAEVAATANPDLRKLVTLLVIGISCIGVEGSSASALRQYESGRFKEAQEAFQRMLEKRPGDPRLHYNAGAAAYRSDSFAEAAKHFSASLASPDLELQERSYYNLGNSFYRLGEQENDPGKKVAHWEQSVRQYEAALKLNPKDVDAEFNLEWVKKKLEELKKDQQKKSDSESQPDSQDKKDPDKQDQDQSPSNADQKEKEQPKRSEDPSKQDQQKQDEEQQKQEKSQQPKDEKKDSQQSQQGQEKNDPNKEEKRDSSRPDDKKSGDGNAAQPMTPGSMTSEQVKRLLDAQKSEEKAMIFVPPEKPRDRRRIFKDW